MTRLVKTTGPAILFAAASLEGGDLHASTRGDAAGAVFVLQSIEGCANQIVGV